jgi:hypothetical protein
MTPRSLFTIVIKILGIFFFKNIIETIPQFISTAMTISSSDSVEGASYIFLGTTVILAFYIFASFVLLARTDKIVNMFKLAEGFEQGTFSFDMPISSILNISLIILGGLILTNEIPNLCRALYSYVVERNLLKYDQRRPDISYSVLIAAKIILGLLLLGERKRIISFILSIQKKNID